MIRAIKRAVVVLDERLTRTLYSFRSYFQTEYRHFRSIVPSMMVCFVTVKQALACHAKPHTHPYGFNSRIQMHYRMDSYTITLSLYTTVLLLFSHLRYASLVDLVLQQKTAVSLNPMFVDMYWGTRTTQYKSISRMRSKRGTSDT